MSVIRITYREDAERSMNRICFLHSHSSTSSSSSSSSLSAQEIIECLQLDDLFDSVNPITTITISSKCCVNDKDCVINVAASSCGTAVAVGDDDDAPTATATTVECHPGIKVLFVTIRRRDPAFAFGQYVVELSLKSSSLGVHLEKCSSSSGGDGNDDDSAAGSTRVRYFSQAYGGLCSVASAATQQLVDLVDPETKTVKVVIEFNPFDGGVSAASPPEETPPRTASTTATATATAVPQQQQLQRPPPPLRRTRSKLEKRMHEVYPYSGYAAQLLDAIHIKCEPLQSQYQTQWNGVVELPEDKTAFADGPLKEKIRKGVPQTLRNKLWKALTSVQDLLRSYSGQPPGSFLAVKLQSTFKMDNLFERYPMFCPQHPPTFGGMPLNKITWLNDSGLRAVRIILCIVAGSNPDILCCPMLPVVVSLLLLSLEMEDAVCAVTSLIRYSREKTFFKKRIFFLRLSAHDHAAQVHVAVELLKKRAPGVVAIFERLGLSPHNILSRLLTQMFLPILPLPVVLRIMDLFLNEGFKILHRYVMVLFKFLEAFMMVKCKTAEDVEALLFSAPLDLTPEDVRQMVQNGLRISLSRDDIDALEKKSPQAIHGAGAVDSWNQQPQQQEEGGEENGDSASPFSALSHTALGLRHRPQLVTSSTIITLPEDWEDVFYWMQQFVPNRVQKFVRAYHPASDGWSLQHLYACCAEYMLPPSPSPGSSSSAEDQLRNHCLILLQICAKEGEAGGNVNNTSSSSNKLQKQQQQIVTVGACLSFLPAQFHRTYLGDGTSFLFTASPKSAVFKGTTGANQNELLPELKFLTIGSGPALRLDDSLQTGTTCECSTFGSPPFTKSGTFDVLAIEVFVCL